MYETWSWHTYSYAFGFILETGCDSLALRSSHAEEEEDRSQNYEDVQGSMNLQYQCLGVPLARHLWGTGGMILWLFEKYHEFGN